MQQDNRRKHVDSTVDRGGPVEDPSFKEPPLKISGAADRYDHREGNDDYTQAGNLFRLMKPEQRNSNSYTTIKTLRLGRVEPLSRMGCNELLETVKQSARFRFDNQ